MAHRSKDPAEMPTLSRGVVLVRVLGPSTALGGVHAEVYARKYEKVRTAAKAGMSS